MKDWKTAAINIVYCNMLGCIREESSHWLDVVLAAGGGHIEHLYNMKYNLNVCTTHVSKLEF